MAEALWNQLGGSEWEAVSAGSKPAGYVHPLAIRAISELDLDISTHESKSMHEFDGYPFDVVVTVCGNAQESCPVYPSETTTLHWPFDDPADATGDDEEQMVMFRRVRDEIKEQISSYLAQSE